MSRPTVHQIVTTQPDDTQAAHSLIAAYEDAWTQLQNGSAVKRELGLQGAEHGALAFSATNQLQWALRIVRARRAGRILMELGL